MLGQSQLLIVTEKMVAMYALPLCGREGVGETCILLRKETGTV